MLSICKEFTFHAAHRLIGHEGLCQFFHGHSYRVAIHVRNRERVGMPPDGSLDSVGRLCDFGDIKRIVGHFIADKWDHATIISDRDPLMLDRDVLARHFPRHYILPINPTAEIMSLHLLDWCQDRLQSVPFEVWRVEIWETDTAKAVATLS